ncbi:T9SS type A sorting domain-containing protein [Nostoc ellipsosporum NOK]|nr:T9SS type A sorting domain-containing protein [Nostoc ellipsosporum NOK]
MKQNSTLFSRSLRLVISLVVICSFSTSAKAQTVLAPGDILFTGYNAIPAAGAVPDTFTFVVLKPITVPTVIYFTERGYQGGSAWQGAGGTEGTISLTTSTALSVGDLIEVHGVGAAAARRNEVPIGTVALVAGGNATTGLSLSNAGDQVIAFQGGSGNPAGSGVTMIAGISWHLSCGTTTIGGWNGAGCTYGAQSSAMPPGLTGGTNAFLVGLAGTAPNNDHATFNPLGTPYTVASLQAAIMNLGNWTQGGATGTTLFDLTPSVSLIVTLPVDLLSFSGKSGAEGNVLSWKTANEVNLGSFDVERSIDGSRFAVIGNVTAVANGTASEQSYHFTDRSANGLLFYRLRMIDIDGNSKYSRTITLKSTDNRSAYVIFPNPVAGAVLYIKPQGTIAERVTVSVTDAVGKNWYNGKIEAAALNSGSATINVSALPAGMYILNIHNEKTGTTDVLTFRK